MSGHVFVVSEWLPKENCEHELWQRFKNLMDLTLENETGCVGAHVTRQIPHPGSPGKSGSPKHVMLAHAGCNRIRST
jgi:hypothetical protein